MSTDQLPAGRPWFRLASLVRREAAAGSDPSINPPIPTRPPLFGLPVSKPQQDVSSPLASRQPPPLQSSPPPSSLPLPPPPESPKLIKPSNATPPPSAAQMPKPEPEPPKTISLPEQGKFLNEKESRKDLNGEPIAEGEKRLITIAGKNVGAIMEFGFGSKSDQAKNNGDEEGRESMAEKTKPKRAVVNSNVQSINNSIVLNSVFKQHSPGVHLNFVRGRQLKGSPNN